MSQNSAVAFPPPQATSADPLTKVLRQGAKRWLAQAIEAEVATWLACYADVRDEQGRQGVVRNAYLPEREVQTGIGAVSVSVPRVRDRSGQGIRFHSSILPP
jgi:putative transposase